MCKQHFETCMSSFKQTPPWIRRDHFQETFLSSLHANAASPKPSLRGGCGYRKNRTQTRHHTTHNVCTSDMLEMVHQTD